MRLLSRGTDVNEIVAIQHREAITTSLKVAEVFGKRHKNVLRDIERLVADLPVNSRLNFVPRDYTDDRGKTWPMYKMNRDGFSILAMGFTGKKALEFKLKFLDAFNLMEKALLNQQNLSWQQQRLECKTARHIETDSIARFVEYATAQGSTSARMYYQNLTKMTHKALFLVKQASPKPFRDMLDSMQLSFLTTAEYLVQQILEDGMNSGLHYKNIYILARDRVTLYAEQLPKQRLLVGRGL